VPVLELLAAELGTAFDRISRTPLTSSYDTPSMDLDGGHVATATGDPSANTVGVAAATTHEVAPDNAFGQEKLSMLSQLQGLNARWFRAWLEKDAATVERLMADDYIYIGPNGLTLDRQALLAIIRSPSYRLDHCAREAMVVRAVGDEGAIVRYRCQASGSFEGTSFTDDHRCVMVCERQAGEWRIVMEQHSFSSK
jgi:hypothetical protein